MECAAVAWVCQNLHVPFVAVKSITDIVDGGQKATRAEFESNLHAASSALQHRLAAVLDLVAGRPLSVWARGPHATYANEREAEASPMSAHTSHDFKQGSSPWSGQRKSADSLSGNSILAIAMFLGMVTLLSRRR